MKREEEDSVQPGTCDLDASLCETTDLRGCLALRERMCGWFVVRSSFRPKSAEGVFVCVCACAG